MGKSGAAILASKVLSRVGILGPVGSSFVTGLVFGLGFDTATQISAIIISAVASACRNLNSIDSFWVPCPWNDFQLTLDSVVLRSVFSRIFDTKGFRYMAYALSGLAIMVASFESYSTIAGTNILPEWIGPVLAVSIIAISFGYVFVTKKRQRLHHDTRTNSKEHKL